MALSLAPATQENIDSFRLTPRQMRDQISTMHSHVFEKALCDEGMEQVMLFGPPGVGKTKSIFSSCEQIAKASGLKLHKVARYEDLNTLPVNPGDNDAVMVYMSFAGKTAMGLSGPITITTTDSGRKQGVYMPPQAFDVASRFQNAFYFFDEIPHVQNKEATLSLLSEGVYEQTRLAQRSLIIAAGNEGLNQRTQDFEMPASFINRWSAYYAKGSVKEWREDFALAAGVHPLMLAWANMHADTLESFNYADWEPIVNFPSFRGVVSLSTQIYSFERSLNLGMMSETQNIRSLSDHEHDILSRAMFARLGHPELVKDAIRLYESGLGYIIPQVKLVYAGKPVSEEFKTTLNKEGLEEVNTAFLYGSYVGNAYIQNVRRIAMSNDPALTPAAKYAQLEILTERFLFGLTHMKPSDARVVMDDINMAQLSPVIKEVAAPYIEGSKNGAFNESNFIKMTIASVHTRLKDPAISSLAQDFSEGEDSYRQALSSLMR